MGYENFTTYTEVDPGNDITVDSATKVSWVDFRTRVDTAYLYKDKGLNHFNGDFNHKFEIQDVAGYRSLGCHWALTKSVKDYEAIVVANEDGLFFFNYNDSYNLYLRIVENGSLLSDVWAGNLASTTYFIEIVRDDDGGANNTGRLTAYIRTGSHTGVLKDTLVIDSSAGEQNDFQYVFAVTSADNNDNLNTSDGYTENLDIGEEAPPGWTGKINTIINPAKIITKAVVDIAKVVGQS